MKLITEHEAAYYLGLSVESLRDLRHRGLIPPAQVTLSRAVYDVADLDAFVRRTEPKHAQRTRTLAGERVTIIYDEGNP